MNLNDRRVIKTKNIFHQTLLKLLKEKNLESISVSEICKIANVNRGTFYLHYDQKENLFEEYFMEVMKDLEKSYHGPYQDLSIQPHEIDPSSLRIFHHVKKYSDFYKIVFSNKASLSYYYLFYNKVKILLEEVLTMYKDDKLNIPLYSAYQANAVIGMIIQWVSNDFSYSLDYMNEQYAHFLKIDKFQLAKYHE
ncbi:TetR/AcrR family transcriptional regulator [Oceanobacillus bengalensis]|uniref:TetR/AcrR family transcriptional regulator n=1 Tax=Oceanobacillus bengalensis TaxID=1435466 RepID=A0A494YRN2_9BACI|nr:TetR/AcrR family transcriptional regulator [Oceanobacillus bengalensis]RKQ12131.1 TetR/AcrR family transcriptional regulator [Oceanobacillus bengalensis]